MNKSISYSAVCIVTLLVSSSLAQYIPTSQYLLNPDLAIGYTDSCAQFWLQTWDQQSGGFYTNIDKYGHLISSWGTNKNMLTQSRNAYGLARAYMLTGNLTYLEYARDALEWMYDHAWDETYGGWFQDLNSSGNPTNQYGDKTAFYQHYALLGIIAYYEATRDTMAWNWLMTGYQHLEEKYWDGRASYLGYYDENIYSNLYARDKSFNATVDAITTHLLYLYLFTWDNTYKLRLQELAEEINQHLVGSMPQQAIGIVEKFDSDWNWDSGETMTIMGHVLKAAWCLGRIHQLFPDPSYIDGAEILVYDVWQNGYDHVFGGPFKDYDRVTGEMLLWGLGQPAKAWWQMEQAIVAGLQLYDCTEESWYLQMADETLTFYMSYFVDRDNGEVYADRTLTGGMAWNEAKGNSGKAGYHSIETGYYTYLYGNLFYTSEPVTLHYNFESSPSDREIILTPLAIADDELSIAAVLHEGQSFANYDPSSRVLTLPAGTGGHFEVTFERVGAQAGIRGDLNQDQVVNILDVLRTVNIILEVGDPPSQYEIWASDCNNDETVNIVDALGIVNVVLSIGECIPGACKTELTPNVLELLKSLESYLSAEDFDRLMTMVKHLQVPADYYLSQNYPNPFNPETEINYALPTDGMVNLEVYNLLGQRVAILIDETQAAGTYTVKWNAAEMPSGTYFYRITANEFTATNTMILMK